ncbi:MAG: hypothetical protein ACKVPX_15745 [Myxococcaceae bacterium]
MQRKATVGRLEVTAVEVERRAGRLTAEEDRAIRMRHGIHPELDAPLPRAAGDNEALADELLLMEMQILRARMRAGKLQGLPRAAPARAAKAKIVRALRRKG